MAEDSDDDFLTYRIERPQKTLDPTLMATTCAGIVVLLVGGFPPWGLMDFFVNDINVDAAELQFQKGTYMKMYNWIRYGIHLRHIIETYWNQVRMGEDWLLGERNLESW